jgi:iron uptake system component EfeO
MNRRRFPCSGACLLLAAWSAGCSADTADTATSEQQVARAVHASLLAEIDVLLGSAKDVQSAAPPPAATGWDAQRDAAAIASSKQAWMRARSAYEHVEGALAPLFPQIDTAIDGRYDDQLADLPAGDDALFDGQGITGLHAIERILWADVVPPSVLAFEQGLQGYRPPSFPTNEREATSFKADLCAKLVADVQKLEDDWRPQGDTIDVGGAFDGLIDLMVEQREKVDKAATNEEESRYSQRTLSDIRDNLEGTRRIYRLFAPWIIAKKDPSRGPRGDGAAIDARVEAGFAKLDATYAKTTGSAIPARPATWHGEAPTAAELATPFGELFVAVSEAVDPAAEASVVSAMNDAARLLGLGNMAAVR